MSRSVSADTAPGWRIALIILGIAMTPVLLASSSLGSRLELGNAVAAILCGSAILALLGSMTCTIGAHARMNTYQIVRFTFGSQGAQAINALLAISLFGWICVTANGFGMAAQDLLAQVGIELPLFVLVALGCLIFIGATAFGFQVLSKVALYAIPIISLILFYNLWRLLSAPSFAVSAPADQMEFGIAVSTVVGTLMVLVATMADFGSFVHNRRHAIIGALLALALAYPLLYIAGALPSALTGQPSLVAAMALVGATIPALLLLLFATITGNAGNLFQGTLVTATLLPHLKKPIITIMLGAVAAVIGSLDMSAWLIPFLLFLGIATPPVAGLYIADFLLNRRAGYREEVLALYPAIRVTTFIAWGCGSLVGFLTSRDIFALTFIPSLDALLVAALLYTLFEKFFTARQTAH
ncbi:MAG: cytosine permease [Enterobacteriaceae bacterium]